MKTQVRIVVIVVLTGKKEKTKTRASSNQQQVINLMTNTTFLTFTHMFRQIRQQQVPM